MITTINNPWITLSEQRNGVTVQRAFAGLDAAVSMPDDNGQSVVDRTIIPYWERELYPNGTPIKTVRKTYKLVDLSETVNDVEGWRMEPRAVLSGFVQSLGYPGIINPARGTLEDLAALPLDAPDGYELHKETRPKLPYTPE